MESRRVSENAVSGSGKSIPLVGAAWALGAAFMAAAFVVPWKLATPHGEEAASVLVLLVSAAILNTMLLPFTRHAGARFSPAALKLTAILAILTLLGNYASAAAIERISAPLLNVMQRAELLVVALVAWIALGERPHWLFWVGGGVAALGFAWMQVAAAEGMLDAGGMFYGILSALSFGTMTVAVRHFIPGVDAVFVNAMRLWASVLLWFILNGGIPDSMSFSREHLLFASLAGFTGPFLGRLFTMQSSRYLEARFTSLILLASPVFAMPMAWLAMGEVPSEHEVEGGAVMLVGIAIPLIGMLRRQSGSR